MPSFVPRSARVQRRGAARRPAAPAPSPRASRARSAGSWSPAPRSGAGRRPPFFRTCHIDFSRDVSRSLWFRREEGNEEFCIEVDGLFCIELGRLFVEYGTEELTDVVDVIGIVVDVFDDVIGVIDDVDDVIGVIDDVDDVDDVIGVIGVIGDVLDVLDVIGIVDDVLDDGIVDMGDVLDDTFVPVLLSTITTAGCFEGSDAFFV